MLLLWGKEGANNILSDVWILEIADNIEDSTWTKVKKSVTFTQVQVANYFTIFTHNMSQFEFYKVHVHFMHHIHI